MNRPTLVSVVIPVWNAEKCLGACLQALRGQQLPAEAFEVLVVDNGSSDGTKAIVAAQPAVRLLNEPTPGSYAARNRGLAEARGELVAFTDADCVPAADWLMQALKAMRAEPNAGVIGGRIDLFGIDGDSALCRDYEHILSFDQQKYIRHGHCATANWLSPAALLRELGGFDPTLRSGGDFELSRRVRAAGRELHYCESMVVQHPCRGSVAALLAKRARTTGGQWPQQRSLGRRAKYVAGVGWQVGVEARKIWAQQSLSIAERARLCGLSALLAGGQYMELCRLALGAEPRRA